MSASAPALTGGSGEIAALRNARLGLWLFIVAETVLFATFLWQYLFIRAVSPIGWVTQVEPAPLGLILTIVLLASAFTANWAQKAASRGDRDSLQGWLIVTILLGLGFIAGQAYEYVSLANQGLSLSSAIYGSLFYTLTGLYVAHLAVGVLVLLAILLRAFQVHFSPASYFGVEGSGLYWQFLVVVWLVMYLVVYLTPAPEYLLLARL